MMRYSTLLVLLFAAFGFSEMSAQTVIVTGTGCAGLTSYTNGQPNDTIYYYPAGQLGSLSATTSTGQSGMTFRWSSYNSGTNQWTQFSVQTNVTSSTVSNLNPGLYSVSVVNSGGTTIGFDYAWISQITQAPSVDVLPIAPGCQGPVNLQGVITPAIVTPYSNLPNSPMFINASTQISVCFSANHTWVSDIAFYLRGPASCGSPTVLLSPNPGAIGQGAICNSGNNVSNLCFTTSPAANLNVCTAATPLSGTYSSYGPGFTPINWSPLYGCEATASGWVVQIYDCIGGDVGSLTAASVVFNGTNINGTPQTVSYASPAGLNSAINDNSCSAASASSYVVPPTAAPPPINCTYGYQWTSNPPVYIPNSTSSLNISIPQLEYPQGTPIPWQDVNFTLSITSSCNGLGYSSQNGMGCLGGNADDTELFDYTPAPAPLIDPVPDLCQGSAPVQLYCSVPGGFWTGPGVSSGGLFSPAVSGLGSFTVTYVLNNPCIPNPTITINVIPLPNPVITQPAPVCVNASPVTLNVSIPGGTWSGPGIVDPVSGLFDPAVAGVGTHPIAVNVPGYCAASANSTITVNPQPNVIVTPSQTVCSNATTSLASAGAVSYSWSPSTYLNNPNISNPTASATSDITYTVTGTDANNCSATATTTLTMVPIPTVNALPIAEICPGDMITLSATGNGSGSYSWTPASGLTGSNTAVAIGYPTVTTTYTVTYTDACGLQATTQVPVEVELPVTVNAGSDTQFCTGSSVVLTGTYQGYAAQTEWVNSSGQVIPSFNPANTQVDVMTAGNYEFVAITPLGCTYSDFVNVIEVPLPVLNLPANVLLCPGGTVSITAGSGWDVVQWQNGSNAETITVAQPGNYDVTVTEQNCSSSGTIPVELVVFPALELGPDQNLCTGSTLTVDAGTSGVWSTNYTGQSIDITSGGVYKIIVTVGPCSISDSLKVTMLPLPVLNLGDDFTACFDQDVVLSAFNSANSDYLWNTGDDTSELNVFEDGVYSVTVSNSCGTLSDSITVLFEDCTYSLYFPNAFTPDGDGINDVWKFTTFNLRKFRLQIYNRWGDPVFTTENTEDVWTGEIHGGEYYGQNGIYFFRATFESNTGEAGERIGHIVVLR